MNSKLKARSYPAPASLHPLKALVLRELDAADQMEAARLANMRQALDDSEAIANRGIEMLRVSVVAIQLDPAPAPTRVKQPFAPLDEWPFTWVRFAEECFQHLNTLDPAEVGEAIAKSQPWTGDTAASSKNGPGDDALEA